MKVQTGQMISVDRLTACPWNPRGEITPESVADLTASIKAKGLLQDIGVWKRTDDDGYYVIYGNRRLVACVNAMMAAVPCKVYECSELEAHEITRIENEARLGVSPIEDSRLVGKMIDLGYTGKEIAAHFGVCEAHITRRRKLLDLSPAWQSRAAEVDIPVDALEHVAAYSREIQDKVLSKVGNWNLRSGWKEMQHFFRDMTADLDHCPFIKHRPALATRCKSCPKRSGATPDLFDDVAEGAMGECLDMKCFKQMREAYRRTVIDDSVPGTVREIVTVKWRSDLDYDGSLVAKPTKDKTAAYVWVDEEKAKAVVKYGPSKAEKAKAAKAEAEKKAADKKESEAREKLLGSAKKKIKAWWKDAALKKLTLAAATVEKPDGSHEVNAWVLLALVHALHLNPYVKLSSDKILMNLLLGKKPFDAWWSMVHSELESKFTGWFAEATAFSAEPFFPDIMKSLTKEERAAMEQAAK